MKNLSIFEPRIEKHYAYKKTCICAVLDFVDPFLQTRLIMSSSFFDLVHSIEFYIG